MHAWGAVTGVDGQQTAITQHAESDLAEVTLRPVDGHGDGATPTLTLWGDWVETAAVLAPAMELAAYGVTRDDYQGQRGYATTADARVIVEPSFIIDVTKIRE
ncbi:MAG: DNA replication factor Dna2 [halophilic archaeon J07HX5]|nr:MAG: DNA replication factor Dna2 [halophilic archaeon J07HX5]